MILAGQRHHVEERHLAEPVAVVRDFGAVDVDDLADLKEIILGVGLDLFRREAGARLVAAAGVADEGGVVADDEDGLMAEFLEQPQLAQRHGMAEMDVDAGRVDAVLDAQRLAGLDAAFELAAQVGLRRDLLGAAADQFELFIDGFHGECSFRQREVVGSLARSTLTTHSLGRRPSRLSVEL